MSYQFRLNRSEQKVTLKHVTNEFKLQHVGRRGLSAYQVAVINGFVGTEAEWLASLEGPSGPPAPDASPTVKGLIQLAGDLAGTAAAPTVPSLAGKASTSYVDAQDAAGAATAAAGLSALADDTQEALDLKADLTYVDTQLDLKQHIDHTVYMGVSSGDYEWQPDDTLIVYRAGGGIITLPEATEELSNKVVYVLNRNPSNDVTVMDSDDTEYPIQPGTYAFFYVTKSTNELGWLWFKSASVKEYSFTSDDETVAVNADGAFVDLSVAPYVDAQLATKEDLITAGTTAQYYRGDKSWQTLNQDVVPDGTTNKVYTLTDKTKLAGIATGATANQTDAYLLARGNHTGTQLASTISDFSAAADARIALNDPLVVHLSGPETITGAKTFTSTVTTNGINATNLSILSTVGTISVTSQSANNFASGIEARKRGTTGDSTAALASGSEVGYHSFYGWHGTAYKRLAYVIVYTDGATTPTTGGASYRIAVRDSAGTEATRVQIYSSGTLPGANLAYTLGGSGAYWSDLFAQRHYFNSTAYIDGSTPGVGTVLGSLVPATNATHDLGTSAVRWLNVYAAGVRLNGLNGIIFGEGSNLMTGTTTGTKIGTVASEKLALWGGTPIVQPTTSVAAATRVGGGGTTLTDTDTFDGYTIAKIAKALRNIGALA